MQESEEGSFISSVFLLSLKKKVRKVLKLCSYFFFFSFRPLAFESEKNAGSLRRPGWNREC